MFVVEKFVSINGESRKAGQLAVFIRFRYCNLNCSYCDTKWANTNDAGAENLTPEQIYEYIKKTGVKNVTLTGGEPLLHQDIEKLVEILAKDKELYVEIETNGSVDISKVKKIENSPSITLDYKTPSSNMNGKMLMDNYELLEGKDTVKFVCGSIEDLEKSKDIIEKYDLVDKCDVYFSPVFDKINASDIVEFMVENNLNGVNLQLQMHKYIWDKDKKGV